MATLRRKGIGGRAAVAVAALVGVAGIAGCESETADLIRELEAARGDCTMDAMRASSDECVQMFERYSEIGSEAINTYIGGVRALEEALRRTGGLSLDTAGLGRALSEEFLPGVTGSGETAIPGWPDPYGYAAGPTGPYPGGYPGGYVGGDPSPGGSLTDGYYGSSIPYDGSPATGNASGVPRAQRGVLLPPDVRLRRPWIEPEYDPRYRDDDADRRSPGYWPGSGYGASPGYGGMPGYGGVPGYGAPGYGAPGYGGYGPYGTAPGYQGYQGYQGYPVLPGYPAYPGYPGYPNGGGYPGYPGYGTVPGINDPRYGDPRYDPRYAPDGRLNDRTIQRSPRVYDP